MYEEKILLVFQNTHAFSSLTKLYRNFFFVGALSKSNELGIQAIKVVTRLK